MRVAIIHYWLVTMRGGEKVLEELCRMYPHADIFTHVVDPYKISPALKRHRIQTSFIGRLPGAVRHYQKYLPLMPLALEQLDLRNYDLVISSESGPAKGVITSENTLHICYCHTPMRYIWNMYHDYWQASGAFTRAAMAPVFSYMRQWDFASASRVDNFVANSTTVQRRIAKTYRREAEIIHPPVAVETFGPSVASEEFYLCCGQLVPYKRVDLAIEAFSRLGKPLIVVGDGSEASRLKGRAAPNIRFLGWQTDQELKRLYSKCRALVFPGEEDFGIVPVEAMASGRPVIGYAKGGILDTVHDGSTGILFNDQTVEGLISAIARFEREETRFTPRALMSHAKIFSRERFRQEMQTLIDTRWEDFLRKIPQRC